MHSNLAKQMLYEFHRKQNAKKPGTVYATYLLTGTRKPQPSAAQTNGTHESQQNAEEEGDVEDTVMRSSPPLPGSSMPIESQEASPEPQAVRTLLLVREHHLSQAKSTFETITGLHVYSLSAGNSLTDLHVLTDCNRQIAATHAAEDPLEAWKQYGTIQNPSVRRRTQKRQPPPAPAPVSKSADVKPKSAAQPTAKPPPTLERKASSKSESKPSSAKATPEPTAAKKPAEPKRQGSGNIFKSFAKTQPPKPKESNAKSASASPAPEAEKDEEDLPMNDFSDEEPDADEGAGDEVEETAAGNSRKDRKKALEEMMEQEDEAMEDAAAGKNEIGDARDEEEAEEHDAGALDKQPAEVERESKEDVKVENGRRRGRRRVMKKKTVKDEDGYLGMLA